MPINKKALENVLIVLGDPKHDHRRTLRTSLVAEGFRGIKDFSDLSAVRDITEKSVPDLVVLDLDMPDGDTCKYVTDVRNAVLGINPFIPVIAVTWDANMDKVRAAVDSGVDDLLAAPISVGSLVSRIEVLIKNRKPFVVTSEYIGPDRRHQRRGVDDREVPFFEVPNTLREKIAGRRVDYTELEERIRELMFAINEQRLIRLSYQVGFLVNLIVPACEKGTAGRETEEHIRRMAEIANEIGMRLHGSNFEHVADLCRTLIDVTSSVASDPTAPDPKDLQLLPELSKAVLAGFKPDRNEADMATEISGMVRKFAERANANALKRAAERSQSAINAHRAQEEEAKERAEGARRDSVLKEKMAARKARDEAAILKAKEKADAERKAREEVLPVKVATSDTPRDIQEWQESRARARKRSIRSSSRD